MKSLLTWMVFSLLACGQCSRLHLIEQFLQQRSINTLLLLHCVQETVDQDVVRISKALRQSFRGSIYHIDVTKNHFHQQLRWHMYCERYKTAVIYNLECSGTEAVLDRLSEKAYFNASFQWLMFGGQSLELATTLLSQQNINYDTKMLLVFESVDPEKQREQRYEFYDVSGTVKRRGGKVIFTPLGFSTPENVLPTIVPQKPDLKGIVLWTVVSMMLWIAVAVILISIVLILALSAICNREIQRASYNDLIVDHSLLGTIAMLCQQGFHASTTVCSTKTVIIVMMGFSFLLLQFYSIFIVGYQLISPPKTINTLEKLIDSSLKMAVENLSYQHDFFARTTEPVALRLYNEKIAPNKYGFVNVSFGIQLVKQGGYAFHCDTAYGYTHVLETFEEQQICELQEVQLYPQRAVQVPMAKGSLLRELFKLNLQLLKEYGLIAYHHAKTFAPKPKCIRNSNKVEPIYLTDVRFAFKLLGTGIAASIVILVLELVYVRLRRWYYFRSLVIPEGFVWID
ncbi:AGAP001811-PA-like protein [Anopheles sinensis]|uniref:AGAP001811-PA-like protein n=1 Tax=Anopheles sinensis TaxID=74873 RepID=A0A084VRN4_ANOSI|nr:AGAP001811-PA-like protein [Anopheles sinensis]